MKMNQQELTLETMGSGDTYLKDIALGKNALAVLEKNYPGHAWFVDCSHETGCLNVQLMYEGDDRQVRIWKYGYVLHITKLEDGNFDKKIRNAGGEILERYHIARKAVKENSLVDFFKKGVDDRCMVA